MDQFSAEAHYEYELDQVIDHQTKKSVQILAHKPRMGETTGELYLHTIS